MKLFVREKSDGRRAPGYALYLLAGAGLFAAIIALHRHAVAPPPSGRRSRKIPSRVSSITQPASEMSRIRIAGGPPPPERRSYRLETGEASAPVAAPAPDPDRFDSVEAAMRDAPAEAPAGEEDPPAAGSLDEVGATRPPPAPDPYAPLPPAFPPADGRGSDGAMGAAAAGSWSSYRDPSAYAAGAGASPAGASRTEPGPPVPRGTLFPVYLLTAVDTSNPSAILLFGAARNVVWRNRCPVPFGTRFLGRLAGAPFRNRLNLAVDTALYPDGRERPIAATAVEADDLGGNLRPGVGATYFPPPTWVQVAPYVAEAFGGALDLLEARARQPIGIGVGGLTIQGSGSPENLQAPLYQASAQAVQAFAEARLKEAEQRYASYYLIPAGTACWLQLGSDFHE